MSNGLFKTVFASYAVIPAQAGIQGLQDVLDTRFREYDELCCHK